MINFFTSFGLKEVGLMRSISKLESNRGFTVIELLVSMAIAGVVMAAVYLSFNAQQKSYIVQEQVVAMQQNIRAAIYYMEREVRMAGYDPNGSGEMGILTAESDSIRFTLDINDGIDNDGDGSIDEWDEAGNGNGNSNDSNEDITYSLYDFGGDGDNDLGRDSGGGNQPLAENIDVIDFVYLDQRIADGVDNDGDGVIDEDDEAVMATPVAAPADIRIILITVIARAGRADQNFTDTDSYYNLTDPVNPILPAQNDNFRRRSLTTRIQCRNLGLI